MNLTKEQQDILDVCEQRNLYISSGPGAGKSTILSFICGKVSAGSASRVLLLTFTNKAAKSIIGKCEAYKDRIIGGTFHGVAYRCLRSSGHVINICDDYKKSVLIKKLFGCKKDRTRFEQIYEQISKSKCAWPPSYDNVTTSYNDELKKYNLFDFDDLILAFIANPQGLGPISYCLVDEMQDTSGPQLEMLRVIQKTTSCKMIGVGDDDQSIYTWRGAKPGNVKDFIKDFNCSIMNMGCNFRSAVKIVEHSSKLIKRNKDRVEKTLYPSKKHDGEVKVYKNRSVFQEIDTVVDLCKYGDSKDIAILYRNRRYKYHLEFALKKAYVDYKVNDALEITDRSAVKTIISCLKIACNSFDIYDLQQASKGLKLLGIKTVNKIERHSKTKQVTLQASVAEAIATENSRLDSVATIQSFFGMNQGRSLRELVQFIPTQFIASFDYQDDMKLFLEDISASYKITAESIAELSNELGLDGKEETDSSNATIELSTVHGYKGLEKDTIIIPFADAFLEPSIKKDISVPDERRLFYVAMTRAKEHLFITYSSALKPRFLSEAGL